MFRRRQRQEAERLVALEAELARLREAVALMERQNARLARDCAPALKENATLRYQLAQCQRDRQVLEMHVGGARAEMQAALNLLAELEGQPLSVRLGQAVFLFAQEGRALGARGPWDELLALARELMGASPDLDLEAWVRRRAFALLALAEREFSGELQSLAHPAAGLGQQRALDALLTRLKQLAGVA